MNELLNSIKNKISYINHNEPKSIHIGYGIDNNYARCAATSIASFCENNPEKYFTFHILSLDLSTSTKKLISILAQKYSLNIIIYEIDISFFKLMRLPTKIYLPIPTYFRFIFPLILKDIEQIFYIDADIICLQNAKELFNIKLNQNIIAAVPDLPWLQKQRNEELHLSNHIYFNAGMLLINVNKWNQLNIIESLFHTLSTEPSKFKYLDQDFLNYKLINDVLYLDTKYNCIDLGTINHKNIVLLHFAAHPKPWTACWPISPKCNSFNRELYQAYEKCTP